MKLIFERYLISTKITPYVIKLLVLTWLQPGKYHQAQETVDPHQSELEMEKMELHTSLADLDYEQLRVGKSHSRMESLVDVKSPLDLGKGGLKNWFRAECQYPDTAIDACRLSTAGARPSTTAPLIFFIHAIILKGGIKVLYCRPA